jgi:hypothetical protein
VKRDRDEVLENVLGDRASKRTVSTNCRSVQHAAGHCRPRAATEKPSDQAALQLDALTVVEKATPGRPAKCPSLGIFLSMGSPQSSVPSIELNLNRTWSPCGWHVVVSAGSQCLDHGAKRTLISAILVFASQRKSPQDLADTITPINRTTHQDYISSLDPFRCL